MKIKKNEEKMNYRKYILLLLSMLFFIGCEAKEKDNNPSSNYERMEESSTSLEKADVGNKLELIDSMINSITDDIEGIKAKVSRIDEQSKDKVQPISLFFLSIIINVIIILLATLVTINFIKKRHSKNPENDNNQLKETVEQLKKEISSSQIKAKEIDRLNKKIEAIEHKVNNSKAQGKASRKERFKEDTSKDSSNKITKNEPTMYLSGIKKNLFTIVDTHPDGSFFEITSQKGNAAEFTFCGSGKDAIDTRAFTEHNSYIISGKLSDAKEAKLIENGELIRKGDGWEVTKPIKIKLI